MMEYRAVGNRCAVRLSDLRLPVSDQKAVSILEAAGFKQLTIDMIELARGCIGSSTYRRAAAPSEAPQVVDCSSFTKWLYGQHGFWLPRRSIQQQRLSTSVPLNMLAKGDLIFVSGHIDYYDDDPLLGVGHVGIYSGSNTVIHAKSVKSGVVETPLDEFTGHDNSGISRFRSAGRYFLGYGGETLVFQTPPHREVETADDLRWIILQSLP
jgi:hypothetical protein